jgi:hypothetical protein
MKRDVVDRTKHLAIDRDEHVVEKVWEALDDGLTVEIVWESLKEWLKNNSKFSLWEWLYNSISLINHQRQYR